MTAMTSLCASSLACSAVPSRFCVFWMMKTIRNVTIVVAVLITSWYVLLASPTKMPPMNHAVTIAIDAIIAGNDPSQPVTSQIMRVSSGTLHGSYGGAPSQAAAAAAFLGAHPGQVSLITADIGSNDLLALVNACTGTPDVIACITAGLSTTLGTLATNYGTLLATIRALAPTARVVLFNYYNPLALALPGSDQLSTVASGVVNQLAATLHASVADAFGTINHTAGSPLETLGVCALTWECRSYHNIHPNSLGYAALTFALIRALV